METFYLLRPLGCCHAKLEHILPHSSLIKICLYRLNNVFVRLVTFSLMLVSALEDNLSREKNQLQYFLHVCEAHYARELFLIVVLFTCS